MMRKIVNQKFFLRTQFLLSSRDFRDSNEVFQKVTTTTLVLADLHSLFLSFQRQSANCEAVLMGHCEFGTVLNIF